MRGRADGEGTLMVLLRSRWKRHWRPETAPSRELKEKENTGRLAGGSGKQGFGLRLRRASGANRENNTGHPFTSRQPTAGESPRTWCRIEAASLFHLFFYDSLGLGGPLAQPP